MGKRVREQEYSDNRMDDAIDKDVAALRGLLEEIPGPQEPHPAYWNNFLIRVHERINAKKNPKTRAWWSPALIWGSLSGVTAVTLVAWMTGLFPFGNNLPSDGSIDVLLPADQSLILVPRPEDEEFDLAESVIMDEEDQSSYSLVLTEEDLDMIDAIESGDDDAILAAIANELEL